MKKFKKIIAMCLTAAMALSVMSIGTFAAAENSVKILSTVNEENYVHSYFSIDF